MHISRDLAWLRWRRAPESHSLIIIHSINFNETGSKARSQAPDQFVRAYTRVPCQRYFLKDRDEAMRGTTIILLG